MWTDSNSCVFTAALGGDSAVTTTSGMGEGKTWWFAIFISEMLASIDIFFFLIEGMCIHK